MDQTPPQAAVDSFMPDTPQNQDLDLFFQHNTGHSQGLCLLQIALLYSTNDIKVWELIQYTTMIIDMVQLYSLH